MRGADSSALCLCRLLFWVLAGVHSKNLSFSNVLWDGEGEHSRQESVRELPRRYGETPAPHSRPWCPGQPRLLLRLPGHLGGTDSLPPASPPPSTTSGCHCYIQVTDVCTVPTLCQTLALAHRTPYDLWGRAVYVKNTCLLSLKPSSLYPPALV